MAIGREDLLRSLDEQRRRFAESLVLTPADSLPFGLADREHTAFLHGLYLTDKLRDEAAQRAAVIQFGGREQAARDLDAIHALLAERLDAAAGSMRLLAGLQAQAATFMSIAGIGDSVLLLGEEGGGHLATPRILERLGMRVLDVPLDYERLCVDEEATRAIIANEQPDFVLVDRREGLRYEDFSWLGEIEGPVKVFDASHYVAQILAGEYANPLRWGFDLMLFTLHKSFPGPQKAGIVARERGELWDRVLSGLSLLVSSSHAESTYLAGLTLLREDWLSEYGRRLVPTAIALERELAALDVPVVPRRIQGDQRWPASHHIWIRYQDADEAFASYQSLARANIHVNYRKLPYQLGWGLRLGTSHAASAGLTVARASEVAELVASALKGASPLDVQQRVAALARNLAKDAISSWPAST